MIGFWVIYFDPMIGKRGLSIVANSALSAWREVEAMGHAVIYVC